MSCAVICCYRERQTSLTVYMETSKEKTITSPGPYIVRLLNSSLNGCEFPLLTGRTLFVVGQSDALTASGQLPDIPADSFFIPLDHGGVNFEIQVDTDATEIILHELKEGNSESRSVQLNTPIQVGELLILIRPESEPWVPEQPEKLETSAKKNEPRFKNGIVAALAGFFILGLWGLYGYLTRRSGRPQSSIRYWGRRRSVFRCCQDGTKCSMSLRKMKEIRCGLVRF